ncbi:MAG: hypothetical protein M1335_01595 [Chloroflexi bacterium]|nr:hypothetical protein [Chloroflexota bacterium]
MQSIILDSTLFVDSPAPAGGGRIVARDEAVQAPPDAMSAARERGSA